MQLSGSEKGSVWVSEHSCTNILLIGYVWVEEFSWTGRWLTGSIATIGVIIDLVGDNMGDDSIDFDNMDLIWGLTNTTSFFSTDSLGELIILPLILRLWVLSFSAILTLE